MIGSPSSRSPQHLYRIDKFRVPPAAREEFLEFVQDIQSFLGSLAGFVRDAIFEQASGPGTFNFVTLVEWESAEAVEGAKKAVEARFKENGFNPQEFRARLEIEADVAIYQEAPRAAA